jgi:hypothetical protein
MSVYPNSEPRRALGASLPPATTPEARTARSYAHRCHLTLLMFDANFDPGGARHGDALAGASGLVFLAGLDHAVEEIASRLVAKVITRVRRSCT